MVLLRGRILLGLVFAALLVSGAGGLTTDTPNTEDESNIEIFIPSNEWKVVKKGQHIPKGLHVRINLETGLTEAKLLDPEDKSSKSKSLSIVPNEELEEIKNSTVDVNKTVSSNSTKSKITADLEEALKKIPNENPTSSENKNFRTLEELKAEFLQEHQFEVKTDLEVMKELFEKHKALMPRLPETSRQRPKYEGKFIESPITVDVARILENLGILVHQIDNAMNFVDMDGFREIIYPHLNGTEEILKGEALRVLGSSLQNNIKVQIHALETNAGEYLLKILALDKREHIKSKALFALGCLVRGFPLAQKQIISKQGMDLFKKILLSDNPSDVKLKLKIIMLLEDLVLEHKSVLENHNPNNPLEEEKLRQYYQVDLMSKLSNPLSCDILSRLLQEYFERDSMDIDTIDKIFSVINTFSHICKHHHYKDKQLLVTFHKMQKLYIKIVEERKKSDGSEEDYEFFTDILFSIENYLNSLSDAKIKDEL